MSEAGENHELVTRIALDQLSEKVLKLDRQIHERMKGSPMERHHIMSYMIRSWQEQVEEMALLLYGAEKKQK